MIIERKIMMIRILKYKLIKIKEKINDLNIFIYLFIIIILFIF